MDVYSCLYNQQEKAERKVKRKKNHLGLEGLEKDAEQE
jgi:hypothetical protein